MGIRTHNLCNFQVSSTPAFPPTINILYKLSSFAELLEVSLNDIFDSNISLGFLIEEESYIVFHKGGADFSVNSPV